MIDLEKEIEELDVWWSEEPEPHHFERHYDFREAEEKWENKQNAAGMYQIIKAQQQKIEELESEVTKWRETIRKNEWYDKYKRLLAQVDDRAPYTAFICGASKDEEETGLAERYHICAAHGADYVEIYYRSDAYKAIQDKLNKCMEALEVALDYLGESEFSNKPELLDLIRRQKHLEAMVKDGMAGEIIVGVRKELEADVKNYKERHK